MLRLSALMILLIPSEPAPAVIEPPRVAASEPLDVGVTEVSAEVESEQVEPFGSSEGLSDAPFEGPLNNGTIGIGSGAGGAFASRVTARKEREAQSKVPDTSELFLP